MDAWITKKAFLIAAGLMALAGLEKLLNSNFGVEAIVRYVASVVGGGLFWGVVGLYIHRKFRR